MDGTGVPMRNSEVAGRAGKQPDGSAKTREAKVVTVWTAESRDDQGKPMRDPGSITYSAAIESAAAQDTNPDRSDFAERVLREATRRSFTKAPRCAVKGLFDVVPIQNLNGLGKQFLGGGFLGTSGCSVGSSRVTPPHNSGVSGVSGVHPYTILPPTLSTIRMCHA